MDSNEREKLLADLLREVAKCVPKGGDYHMRDFASSLRARADAMDEARVEWIRMMGPR